MMKCCWNWTGILDLPVCHHYQKQWLMLCSDLWLNGCKEPNYEYLKSFWIIWLARITIKYSFPPQFLYALPQKEGYEFFLGQWSGHELHFTSLINVQVNTALAAMNIFPLLSMKCCTWSWWPLFLFLCCCLDNGWKCSQSADPLPLPRPGGGEGCGPDDGWDGPQVYSESCLPVWIFSLIIRIITNLTHCFTNKWNIIISCGCRLELYRWTLLLFFLIFNKWTLLTTLFFHFVPSSCGSSHSSMIQS